MEDHDEFTWEIVKSSVNVYDYLHKEGINYEMETELDSELEIDS